jgi:hypothetical protein
MPIQKRGGHQGCGEVNNVRGYIFRSMLAVGDSADEEDQKHQRGLLLRYPLDQKQLLYDF